MPDEMQGMAGMNDDLRKFASVFADIFAFAAIGAVIVGVGTVLTRIIW